MKMKIIASSIWIAFSRILIVLIMSIGIYNFLSALDVSPHNTRETLQYIYPPLRFLITSAWNSFYHLFAVIIPLAILYFYDIKLSLHDVRVICIDAAIGICSITLLFQWNSLSSSYLYIIAALLSIIAYIVACFYLPTTLIKELALPKSSFGAESDETPDGINRGFFYDRIVENIREVLREQSLCGKVWSLYGEWGSGKTHLLNYIERETPKGSLKEANIECRFCSINLWQISNREELWRATRGALEKAYGLKETFKVVQKIRDILSSAGAVDARYAIAHTICKEYLSNDDTYNLVHLQAIGKKNPERRIILFIDNLERTDADVVKELLPLLERLKRLPNLLVITAVAMHDLIENCKCQNLSEELLRSHLIKLADNVIYMPPMDGEVVTRFFKTLVKEREASLGFNTYLHEYAYASLLGFDNLRQIYRVVDLLLNLELRYFSEGARYRSKEQLENTLHFVELVFDIELLKTFYPETLSFLKTYCEGLKKAKKIVLPNDFWKDCNSHHLNEDLFESICMGIQRYTREEFFLALNMEYTKKEKILPNLCELLAYIAYDSYDCDLLKTIERTTAAVRGYSDTGSIRKCVLAYIADELSKELILETHRRFAAVYLNQTKTLDEDYYPSLPLESMISVLRYLNTESKFSSNVFIKYFRKLSFDSIALLTARILESMENNTDIPLRATRKEVDRVYEADDSIKCFCKAQNNKHVINCIFCYYVKQLINAIFSVNIPNTRGDKMDKLRKYRAFDKINDYAIINQFRSWVEKYCSHKKIIDAKNIHKFLHHILDMKVSDENGVSIMYYSRNAHDVFQPLLRIICEHISTGHDISIKDADSILELAQTGIKQCKKALLYPKYDHEDTPLGQLFRVPLEPISEDYRAGVHLLRLWFENDLIPVLRRRRIELQNSTSTKSGKSYVVSTQLPT